MADPPPSSSSGIPANSPSLHPHRLRQFTPIHEGNESEEDGSERDRRSSSSASTPRTHVHQPTPLHPSSSSSSHPSTDSKPPPRKRRVQGSTSSTSISCNNCRPSTREHNNKTTSLVVPVLDGGGGGGGGSSNRLQNSITIPSPNAILKSILSTLALRSPRSVDTPSSSSSSAAAASSVVKRREERWKLAAAEVSQKLMQANRRRDEAILEAAKVKRSMAELEKKMNKLEVYCHTLKSGIEGSSSSSTVVANNKPNYTTSLSSSSLLSPFSHFPTDTHDDQMIIENFLTTISESRSAVRCLSRAMTTQIRQTGVNKLHDRISSSSSSLSSTTDLKLTLSKNPRTAILYLESLLHQTLFTDFETPGFSRTSTTRVLNPAERCEAQYAAYAALRELTWEEVLGKGTKHFSEDFSGFCDRKMSEVVGLLGWNRAWPEPLLQAFFGACKGVWLVHLLANSVHPSLTVFRVEKGVGFDSVFMEDLGRDKVAASGLVPSLVRVMVAPGFYVYDNVVKCKVLCRYASGSSGGRGSLDMSSSGGNGSGDHGGGCDKGSSTS